MESAKTMTETPFGFMTFSTFQLACCIYLKATPFYFISLSRTSSVHPSHPIQSPEEQRKEGVAFTYSIDLNENGICGRITFPFITAGDRSNATCTTIDHTGRGREEKKKKKTMAKTHTHTALSRCNVIDGFMDKLNNKNGTNARNRYGIWQWNACYKKIYEDRVMQRSSLLWSKYSCFYSFLWCQMLLLFFPQTLTLGIASFLFG